MNLLRKVVPFFAFVICGISHTQVAITETVWSKSPIHHIGCPGNLTLKPRAIKRKNALNLKYIFYTYSITG